MDRSIAVENEAVRTTKIGEASERQVFQTITGDGLNVLPTMLNIKTTAERSGLAVHHVRQLVKQNKVAYIMSGKKVLINFDSVISYLQAGDMPQNPVIDKNVVGTGIVRRLG